MANTRLEDLLPFILISLVIYFLLNLLYFKYLTNREKWKNLFDNFVFLGITYFLTIGYLQNDPWAQIGWMLGFLFYNVVTWFTLLFKFFRLRKRNQ